MPYFLQIDDFISAFTNTYNADGNTNAATPVQITLPLVGTVNHVQKVVLRAAATTTGAYEISEGAATNGTTATATLTRPLGGSGFCSIAKFRGVQLVVSADEVTSAEVAAGSVASRVSGGYLELLSSPGDEVFFTAPFATAQPGQKSIIGFALPAAYDSASKVRVVFDTLSPRCQAEILTIADQPS